MASLGKRGKQIGETFLTEIDSFIKSNIRDLTCDDIYQIYFGFFNSLKRWRSTSANFTGYSELLILRSLLHCIGDDFTAQPRDTPKNKKNDNQIPWIFKSNNYEIAQNVSLRVNNRRKQPDIYVKNRNGKVEAIIQIKVVLTSGRRTVDKILDDFLAYHNYYQNVKCLLIIYDKWNYSTRSHEILTEYKKDNSWFDFKLLEGKNTKICQVFKHLHAY